MKNKQNRKGIKPTSTSIKELLVTQRDQKAYLELSKIRKEVHHHEDQYEGILECFYNKQVPSRRFNRTCIRFRKYYGTID